MEDIKFLISHYVSELWRRKWTILLVAWLVGLPLAYLAAKQKDVFEARAGVLVTKGDLVVALLGEDVFLEDTDAILNRLQLQIYNRTALEEIVHATDLDLNAETLAEKEKLLQKMGEKLVLLQPRPGLFRFYYTHTNPEKARDVVQAAVNLFVERGMEGTDTSNAEDALDAELAKFDNLAPLLESAEKRLADFERENPTVRFDETHPLRKKEQLQTALSEFNSDKEFYEGEISRLQQQLASTPATIKVDERRIEPGYIPRPTGELVPIPPRGTSIAAQRYEAGREKIKAMEREMEQVLRQFTPAHPDVQTYQQNLAAARAEVEGLRIAADQAEAELNAEIRAAQQHNLQLEQALRDWEFQVRTQQATVEPIMGPNPGYQTIQSEIARMRNKLSSLLPKIDETLIALNEAEDSVVAQPEILQSYAKLQNEVDVRAEELETISENIAKLEATLGAKEGGNIVEIIIDDPPRLPANPILPNRMLLFIGAGLVSLMVGGGIAALRALLADNLPTTTHLRNAFDLPILGSVSSINERQGSTSGLVGSTIWFLALLCFLALFTSLIYVYHFQLMRPF